MVDAGGGGIVAVVAVTSKLLLSLPLGRLSALFAFFAFWLHG
jgi:hypothetical protein